MSDNKMFQVSTLQALALGYSRAVVNIGELMQHGDIGLGTFEDVSGAMIVLDGIATGQTKRKRSVSLTRKQGCLFRLLHSSMKTEAVSLTVWIAWKNSKNYSNFLEFQKRAVKAQ